MSETPERLFRDDAGAAVERAARLEDENQQLRAEIARMKHGAHPRREREATTVRTGRPAWARAILIGSCGFMFLGVVLAARSARPPLHHARPPRIVVPLSHVIPAPTLTATPAATTDPLADDDDCSTPYTYDDHRVKRYKLHCIHPERAPR